MPTQLACAYVQGKEVRAQQNPQTSFSERRAREIAESQASGPFTGLFKQQQNRSLLGSVTDVNDNL